MLSATAQHCELDTWHDPMLMNSIFISDALYHALTEADTTEWWFLHPCDVDTDETE